MDPNKNPTEYAYNGNEAPSEAVITAVATAFNRDPLEMEPLYEFIDPDALDAIFHSRSDDNSDPDDIQVKFYIDTDHVIVTGEYIRVLSTDKEVAD
jgi:hypothetical protein